MAGDIESLFTCLVTACEFFGTMSVQTPVLFSYWFFLFLSSCEGRLYILGISRSSDMIRKSFLSFFGCLSTFFMVSFE